MTTGDAITSFRGVISADGSTAFPAEAGRYHLYVSHACPWAHRALLARDLRGLDGAIGLSVVHWDNHMPGGWHFDETYPDHAEGVKQLRELYMRANPDYAGRITVPALWDIKQQTMVNNESADMVRMFNAAFDALSSKDAIDLYPRELRDEIDKVNEFVHDEVVLAVYGAIGPDATQAGIDRLYAGLDGVEAILATKRYLTGTRITEADVRLFTTLIRFDVAFYHAIKRDKKKRLRDYPHTHGYLLELYQLPRFRQTVDFEHIVNALMKKYAADVALPTDDKIDWDAPHGRDALSAQ